MATSKGKTQHKVTIVNMKNTVISAVTAVLLLSGCASHSNKPNAWICVLVGGGVGAAVGDSVAPGTGLVGGIIGGYLCDEGDSTPPIMAKDADNDGITDEMDKCPSTPAGAEVDSMGCAKDSDNDGVADYMDHCPGTPNIHVVDHSGCTKYIAQNINKELVIKFDNNQAVVKEAYLSEVKAIAVFLNKYPQVDVTIEGHTSKIGSAAYNQQLSEKRAKAVATLLIDRYAIEQSRVKVKGYGESRLLDEGDTATAHKRNRRIVASMSAQEDVPMKR